MPSAALSAEMVGAQLYGRLISNARHMRPLWQRPIPSGQLQNEARRDRLRPSHVIWVGDHAGSLGEQNGPICSAFAELRVGAHHKYRDK